MEALIFHHFQHIPARPYNRLLGQYLLRGQTVVEKKMFWWKKLFGEKQFLVKNIFQEKMYCQKVG